jgi:hypothetical protein
MSDPSGTIDFFISYRGAQAAWARWVNWVVRSAGFSTVLMDEFPVGTTWTSEMRKAVATCRRLIPLYSKDYWASGACVVEFDAYWHQSLKDDAAHFLFPLEIERCEVPKIHATLLACRIHELSRDEAQAAILKVLSAITPIAATPAYTEREPSFPRPVASSAAPADWPEVVPELRWPLADHDVARAAFATLVTRGAPYRLLLVKGESETGKTHLTRQFFNNAQRRVPGCVCGRFDFKGTGDLQLSLNDFALHLQVPLRSTGANPSTQLNDILFLLAQKRQPTLLIFDTCESSGEAERWLRESLLTPLHRYPWLRVVLAGKSVPERHGLPWEEDSLLVALTPPDPEHWHAWGVENNRPVNLEFVKQAHSLCGGKASILAGLCGPKAS